MLTCPSGGLVKGGQLVEKFNLKKDYRYLIYGAAAQGRAILKNLRDTGYYVAAFLDRRADDLKVVDGVIVKRAEYFNHSDFENTVVVVALTNPFEHTIIADYLHELGYDKIIYNIFPGMEHVSEEIFEFKRTYGDILGGFISEQNFFCKYNDQWVNAIFEDGALIRDDGEYVVAYLPFDLCAAPSKEYLYKMLGNQIMDASPDMAERFDQPIYMAAYEQCNLFRAFFGTLKHRSKVIDVFVDFWKRNRFLYRETFPRTREGREELLINRSNTFWGMFRSFQQNGMDFFIQCPLEVCWNEKGYFNIVDGTHRIAFFLAIGLHSAPARILKRDYEEWINREKLVKCIDYVQKIHIPAAYAPIPHPNFYFFPTYRDLGGVIRLQIIEEVLMFNHIKVKGKKVLDAGSNYCYLSQNFTRMGAEVTAVEYNPNISEFGRLLNELLYCSNIKSVCCGLDEINTAERFSFTVMLTVLYPYMNQPLGLKILQNIDIVTEDFLIWESGKHPEEEIRFILENSSFDKYLKLSETFGTGKLREMGIFCKKHVQMKLPEWF